MSFFKLKPVTKTDFAELIKYCIREKKQGKPVWLLRTEIL